MSRQVPTQRLQATKPLSAIWISTTWWLVISEILHTRLSFLRALIKLKSFWWTICCAVALSHLATNRNLATGFLIQWEEFWNTDDLDNLDLAPPAPPLPEPCLAHLGVIDSVSPRLRRGKLQTNWRPWLLTGVYFNPRGFSHLGWTEQNNVIPPTFPRWAQDKPVHLATGAGCQMNTLILDLQKNTYIIIYPDGPA